METLVGIFPTRRAAANAVCGLRAIGLSDDSMTFVTPEHAVEELPSVPTTDAEADGMGKTLSGYVGAVVGGSAGLGIGSAIASMVVPGVGPVIAAGIGAAALLGLGGAAVGAALGDATEKALDMGVPRDDVLFYRELLKQGKSIVVAAADNADTAAAIRAVLHNYNAEDLDAARQEWQSRRSDRAA